MVCEKLPRKDCVVCTKVAKDLYGLDKNIQELQDIQGAIQNQRGAVSHVVAMYERNSIGLILHMNLVIMPNTVTKENHQWLEK